MKLMDKKFVVNKIEKALLQSEKGRAYSETEVRKILSKWLKSKKK